MSVPVPSTPTNPADELRSQIRQAIGDPGSFVPRVRMLNTVGVDPEPVSHWSARAVESLYAPVLEGLYREIDRLRDKLDEERQANSHETGHLEADRECMVQEIQRLRRERDAARLWNKAHETNNAALGKTNRELAAERDALSSLLRGMARRVGQMREQIRLNEMFGDREHAKRGVDLEAAQHAAASWERAAHGNQEYATVLYAELLQARAEIEQLCARPSVSDQTPATPDDTALTVAMSAARKVSVLPPAPHIVMAMLDALAKAGFLAPTAVISDLRATAADLLTADDVTDHDRVAAQTLTDYADRLGKAAPSSVQGGTTPRDDFDAIAAAEYRATPDGLGGLAAREARS